MTSKLLNKSDAVDVIVNMTRAYMQAHGRAPRTLIAVGGTAMAMHGLRPLSEDIDLYAAEDAFLPIAEDMERQSGIRIDVTSKTTLWGTLNIQWSVYGRIINGFDDLETHLKRLSTNLPAEGSVRCLQISEKQFAQMKLLVGVPKIQEKKINAQQLLLL